MFAKFWQVYHSRINTWIFLSIIAGFLFGLILPQSADLFAPIGDLFLRSLKLFIVPLVFFSLIVGILNLGSGISLGRIGLKTVIYYISTTMLAVLTGLLLVNLIQPGKNATGVLLPEDNLNQQAYSLWDVILSIVPENIVEAAGSGNILGLIFFSCFLSLGLIKACNDQQLSSIKNISQGIFQTMLWMIDKVMLFAPIGIFCLIASLVSEYVSNDQLESLGEGILKYSITVVLGLLVHGLITLPLILSYFKVNPLKFFKAMFPAIGTAFSTASSMATLPITLECLRDNKVPNRVAGFVAPLGGTINMDGTAIYEAVAVVFIANIYGVDLTLGQQLLIFITATFSAIGAAGTPGAGLVMMIMVLNVVNLPAEGINLVIVVDRILDMLRTATNVWGDSIGAKIVSVSEKIEEK